MSGFTRNFIRFDGNRGISFVGNPPFIHWYEGDRSIGLFHTKSIWFYSNTETVTVSTDPAGVFFIYNPTHTEHRVRHIPPLDWTYHTDNEHPVYLDDELKIDGEYWSDINSVLATRYTSKGTNVNGCWIHRVIFIARADEEGEYIGDFYIEDEEYKIGIVLVDEDESLGILLANKGLEMPPQFTKALATGDLYEDGIDWALVNEKRRELLNNYTQTLFNKGSHESLINLFKWFDYGNVVDLVPVNRRGEWFRATTDLMSSEARTTYFVIRSLAYGSSYTLDDNGNPLYQQVARQWTEEELALKLYLLSYFFEVYFMPIHLDIIRATIDHIAFSPNTLVTTAGSGKEYKYVDTIYEFPIRCGSQYVLKYFEWEDDYDLEAEYPEPIASATISSGTATVSGNNVIIVPPREPGEHYMKLEVTAVSGQRYERNFVIRTRLW